MRTRTFFLVPLLALLVSTACEAPDPTTVEASPTTLPEFAKLDNPAKPAIEVLWIYKDAYDKSPINLSGVLASQSSQGMSETGLIPVTILGADDLDLAEAPIIVTLGVEGGVGTPWEMDGQGNPLTEETYRDEDGFLDLIVHFNLRTMFENGDIDLNTKTLCLKVTTADGESTGSCQAVRVI